MEFQVYVPAILIMFFFHVCLIYDIFFDGVKLKKKWLLGLWYLIERVKFFFHGCLVYDIFLMG